MRVSILVMAMVMSGCATMRPIVASKDDSAQFFTRADGTKVIVRSYRLWSQDGRVCEVSSEQFAAAVVGRRQSCAWMRNDR